MNLDEVLVSERTEEARKAGEKAFKTYLASREVALAKVDSERLKEEIRAIKEHSIKDSDKLRAEAVKNFEGHGIKVFEAKDAAEARQIILKLVSKDETVVKAKSNTINEIELSKELKALETDCGDFIVQLTEESSTHPVAPALHIPLSKIIQKIKEKYGADVEEEPAKIIDWIKENVKKEIAKADVGLTGANAISADGSMLILENEGNISLVTRLPKKHVVVAGIDKIVPTIQDALKIAQAESLWGGASDMPTYINIISGPSGTLDIGYEKSTGMYGAKEVYLVLVDNGRSDAISKGFEELLYCINCGACLYFCPIYRQVFDKYGFHYLGGIGVGKTAFSNDLQKAFEAGLYYCAGCQNCQVNCPVKIDVPAAMKRLRELAVSKGLETEVNKKMIEQVRAFGNPMGKVEEGKTPKQLYCC